MSNPLEITVGRKNVSTKNVSHSYYVVGARDRYNALKRLVDANPDVFAVIFCRTKRDTQRIAEKLIEDGYNAAALHGDLSQNQRDLVMKSFRNKQVQMLVATDVAARGIDVEDITHVINYQLPDEVEVYTHRSGRTGRAGKSGKSFVIITRSEQRKIKAIEKVIGQAFNADKLPTSEEICESQILYLSEKVKNTEVNHNIDVILPKINEMLSDFDKEELIKKFFSVEFSRFYDYYKKAPSLDQIEQSGKDNSSFQSYGDEHRYFINLGAKDGFTWMSLKDFLKAELNLGRDDIGKVDVKKTFSFFNTHKSKEKLVLNTFDNYDYNGRLVSVEITRESKEAGTKKKSKSRRDNSKPKSFSFKSKSKSNKSRSDKPKSKKNQNRNKSLERRRRKG